jgi:addiction module RelE/StbE family toxin
MIIVRHRIFVRNYRKRILPDKKLVKRFEQRLKLFVVNQKEIVLKDHALIGAGKGFRSFSITGDIRVIYRKVGDVIELYDVGSHNQVY